jgi:lantibiotic modifying enzyme
VYLGLGSGIAGIVYGLDRLAELTGDSRYERYALAGAAYLESQISDDGAVPVSPGYRSYQTGLYQGAAGVAYAYFSLYRHTGNTRWLTDANRLMHWVATKAQPSAGGLAWSGSYGADADPGWHTSMAWGAAGIGWVALQAYGLTGDATYQRLSLKAAMWLLSVGERNGAAITWPETVGQSEEYSALDLGVAGVGYFLFDLSLRTGRGEFHSAAVGAAQWLRASVFHDATGPLWGTEDCVGCGGWQQFGEPSRHWGAAGIAAFAARLRGGDNDMPRDVPAFGGRP